MSKQKLKMSNKRFLAIFVPICAILLALTIVLFPLADHFRPLLDNRLGRGKRVIETIEGAENWDTEYYGRIADPKKNSEEVALNINREGEVLLKNNGVLPLEKGTKVVPFGKAYFEPFYSGTGAGSSSTEGAVTPKAALSGFFTVSEEAERLMDGAKVVETDAAPGTRPVEEQYSLQHPKSTLADYDPSVYDGLSADQNSVGIVFIARSGAEGGDAKHDGYADGTPHYLALSQNERGAIRAAKEKCGSVVLVLNSPAVMELSPFMAGELEVDAILWTGMPGTQGFTAMAEVLCGEVNPSGKTPDIWPTDFTADPTYQNFGAFEYSNATFSTADILTGFWMAADPTGPDHQRFYVEYQEGIYLGYRYYETADEVLNGFTYGTLDGKGAIATPGAVAYPFGYGLSYTTFTQEIVSFNETPTDIELTVKVTNTGDVAGKEVVQVYFEAPYTQLDEEYRIEKAAANLVAFDKTDMLQPNASEEVTLSFLKEDMASYCYTRTNPDDTKGCYFLENGEYEITVRANSHDVLDSETATVEHDIWYDNSNPRQSEIDAQAYMNDDGSLENFAADGGEFVAATNQFQESNDYMLNDTSMLSRADFEGTFPVTAPNRQKQASQTVLDNMQRNYYFDYQTDERYGDVEGSALYTEEYPVSNAENGVLVSDMRGKSYHAPEYDALLDQIDWENDKDTIESLLYLSVYATVEYPELGLVATNASDGDTGLSDGGASYPCKPIVSATWNTRLAYEMGEAIGQEALANGVNDWYAPAMNTHRSPFSGRNFEYFSEDGVLAGKMAAPMVSGAATNGLFCHIKHFFLNDQEACRHLNIATWADEQTMREIYLKPYEIVLKEAMMTIKYISDSEGTVSEKTMRAGTAVMTALNAVGTMPAACHYGVLTNVLRGEWGFDGFVLTDLSFYSNVPERNLSLRAGTSAWMSVAFATAEGYDTPIMRNVMRRSLHDIIYAAVNSAAYDGVAPGSITYYTMSPWEIGQIAGSCIIWAGIAAVIVWGVVRFADSKKHPEKYKHKEKI